MIELRCPKCQSTQVCPTFCTPYEIGCIPCGHEFDLRGSFWQRIWGALRGVRYANFWS
jgi:hypothetical protein